MTSTSSTHLTCLCGAISVPGTLLEQSVLPLSAELCHCNTCRYNTGGLGTPWLTLQSSPSDDILTKLVAYSSSTRNTRYFCQTCGCHCFLYNHPEKQWFCLGGIVEATLGTEAVEEKGDGKGNKDNSKKSQKSWQNNVTRTSEHIFIPDTIDGGLAPFMLWDKDHRVPTWTGYPKAGVPDIAHEEILAMPKTSLTRVARPGENDHLEAKCLCGGVSLLLKRANYSHDENARYTPRDRTKYVSYMCACRSCRLSTGVAMVPWTTVPAVNVFIHGKASANVAFNPKGGNDDLKLKYFCSSENVVRSFCSTCGASVSFWTRERKDEIDLLVGIFRAEEGSMARNWLEWDWGRCSFSDEAVDEEMCKAWKGSAFAMNAL